MQLTTTHKLDAAPTPVHSVTIFQTNCAEVVRKFAINLKTGDNTVEISQLPSTMVTESLRVGGIGQAMLSDVVAITPKSTSSKQGKSGKSDTLIALEGEKELIESQRRVLDHQALILVNYSKSITGEHVAPDDMLSFLGSFISIGDENAKAIAELNRRQRDVEERIAKEIDDPAEGHNNAHLRNIKVKLVINADEDHLAEITLTYLVKKASWTPVFDLRAVTGSDGKPTNKVALHYRATVEQSTGEDWIDATLSLSTASPDSMGTKIPTLSTLKIIPKVLYFGQTKGMGLFGQAQPQSNQNTYSQQANTSLFGKPLPNTAGFSYGSAPNPPALPPSNAGPFGTTGFGAPGSAFGAFGSINAPSTAGPSGDLFGASAAVPSTGGLFGATSVPAAPNSSDASSASNAATAATGENAGESELTPLPEMEIPGAVAKENSLAANFQVRGTANIKSDGSSHRVAIAIMDLTADIYSMVVPRSLNGAYLHCTIHNSSTDTHLLAGNMGIYIDDGYITNTKVPHVAPGDSFKCSLGRDHSIAVTFDQKAKRLETQTSLFGANPEKVLYTATITLKNKRDTPIKNVIVRDVVPVSEAPQVKVILLKPEGLAEAEEGKDINVTDSVKVRWYKQIGDKGGMKEGRHRWLVDLEAKETKVLVTEWEVSSSPGYHWTYTSQGSSL